MFFFNGHSYALLGSNKYINSNDSLYVFLETLSYMETIKNQGRGVPTKTSVLA
jgi:hypothetical protein